MLNEKNTAFKLVLSGTLIVMCLVLTIPFLKELFRFGTVSLSDALIALTGGLIAIGLMELLKVFPKLNRS